MTKTKTTTGLLASALTLLAAPSALAMPISVVGGVDSLVDWATISPSDASEAQFIADHLGLDAEMIGFTKLEGSIGDSSGEGGYWQQADDDEDVWYLDFSQFISFDPIAFLVKTGSGVQLASESALNPASPTYNTFLYLNDDSYGVIDLGAFTRTRGNVDIEMVSHVSVPEPGTLSLLGAGLLAAGFFRRRKR